MFHEHNTLQTSIRVTLESAGAGLLVSAVQNALDKCVYRGEMLRAHPRSCVPRARRAPT
jgi:hypothetical protein